MLSKILVTGAAGFVGFHLSHYLRYRGYEVLMLDIDDRLDRVDYYNEQLTLDEEGKLQLHRADLTRDIRDIPNDLDAIIHLAASPHVDYSYYYPAHVQHNNVLSTTRLMDLAAKRNIPFILGSSVEVYGGAKSQPYQESDPYYPMSPYASSKVSCEVLLHTYIRCFGLKGKIFRLTNLYGPWQAPDRIIPRNICRICDQEPLDIQSNVVRDFLYIDDAIRAITTIMERGQDGHVYNISTGRGTSMSEVGSVLSALAGDDYRLDTLRYDQEFTNARGASLVIRSDKLQQELGWSPEIDLTEGLARTLNWYEEHRLWGSKFRDQYMMERSDRRFIIDVVRRVHTLDLDSPVLDDLMKIG